MKNKKSKIVAPALGLILLSTAASISGSVAWFTANRTAELKAGQFAVVNTNGNLDYSLSNGIGVNFTGASAPYKAPISQKSGYTLTDASLDITSASHDIVIPNDSRKQVEHILALENLNESSPNKRDLTSDIYSAFAWDITFSLSFPESATKNVGLFFDAENSWAHTYNAYEAIASGATSAKYYTDPECTTDAVTAGALSAGNYYTKAPKEAYVDSANPGSTAYGFRMAFIPKTIPSGSAGVAKVWSPFQTSARSTYVHGIAEDGDLFDNSGNPLATPYADYTLIHSASTQKEIPTNSSKTATTAAQCDNYLGFFAAGQSSVNLTFTVVAWYEGTDISIVPEADVFEEVTTNLIFGVSDLAAA